MSKTKLNVVGVTFINGNEGTVPFAVSDIYETKSKDYTRVRICKEAYALIKPAKDDWMKDRIAKSLSTVFDENGKGLPTYFFGEYTVVLKKDFSEPTPGNIGKDQLFMLRSDIKKAPKCASTEPKKRLNVVLSFSN